MSGRSRLVSARLMRSLSTHYTERCKLCAPVTNQHPDTGEEQTTYNVPEVLTACYIEPITGDQEIRRTDQTLVISPYTIALANYYPQLTVAWQIRIDRGVSKSEIYNIVSVVHDHTKTFTMLTVERVDG